MLLEDDIERAPHWDAVGWPCSGKVNLVGANPIGAGGHRSNRHQHPPLDTRYIVEVKPTVDSKV